MKWLDTNHVDGEMSDEEIKTKIDKEAKTRDIQKYGRDGVFSVYEEKFTYKGISYLIKITRYYQIGVPFSEIRGMNHLGKWAVLEYPNETKELAEFIHDNETWLGCYEWLYQDTLHSWNEKQTLLEMVDAMHEAAKKDIDELAILDTQIRDKCKMLREQLKKLRKK